MTMNFESDREAFLAVLNEVIGADAVGSLEERDFLFQRVTALELFSGVASGDFNKLLGTVTDKVYESLPVEDGLLTAAGTDALLDAAQQRLSPALRKVLVELASELGGADGEDATETALLAQIKIKLS
jgi:hypothetical protein